MDNQDYLSLDELLSGDLFPNEPAANTGEDIRVEQAVLPDTPVLTDSLIEHIQNPPFLSEMRTIIEEVDAYAWNRGIMGLDSGFESINDAFNGLNTGVIIIAAGSNVGKSAFLLEMMWRTTKKNQFITEDHPKKAFCLYFSLDDSNNELMPRLAAIDQQMPINCVLYPKKYMQNEHIMQKRSNGLKALSDNVAYFAMKDSNYGDSIEYIEATMQQYKEHLEQMAPGEFRLVVFIDNFYDITVEKSGYAEDLARFDYTSAYLDNLSVRFDSPIICSGEFRKINVNKRPSQEDLKSSGKIFYRAKGVVLAYNEVGIKKDNANLYWEMADARDATLVRKMPVFEMDITKNKFSSYKGRKFLRFNPDFASFYEVSEEENRAYHQMMKG